VALEDTLAGFDKILSGEMDSYPEAAFLNVGTIAEVVEKGKSMVMESAS
jgi:F-type H+-transporting ATPase subunit beta